SGLADEGAFAGHVGAGDERKRSARTAQIDIVGYELRAEHLVENGVASLHDVERPRIIDDGPDPAAPRSLVGEREEDVELGGGVGERGDVGDAVDEGVAEAVEELALAFDGAGLRGGDLALELAELGGGEAFGVAERLGTEEL